MTVHSASLFAMVLDTACPIPIHPENYLIVKIHILVDLETGWNISSKYYSTTIYYGRFGSQISSITRILLDIYVKILVEL